jgi:hypothetical protein
MIKPMKELELGKSFIHVAGIEFAGKETVPPETVKPA